MTTPSKTRGRPADRRNAIYDALVQRIVEQQYLPKQKIPTLREIASEFQASSRTVQTVLNDLADSGFTRPQGQRGTFVNEDPPHLHRHLVVHDGAERENRFRIAILEEVKKLRTDGWTIDIVILPDNSKRTEMIRELSHQVQRQQYAGIAFTSNIKELIHTPLYNTPNVPRVVLSSRMKSFTGPFQFDDKSSPLFDAVIPKLSTLGAKKVGAFLHAPDRRDVLRLQKDLTANHFETKNAWLHSIHHSIEWEAYAVVELLMSQPKNRRPDTLIIYNDNLTEMVTRGVRDFGPKNESITVLSHCNFPMKPKAYTPVLWFGYNVNEILLRAFQLIELERRAPSNGKHKVKVLPYIEDEI